MLRNNKSSIFKYVFCWVTTGLSLFPAVLCGADIETKRHIVIFQPSVDVVNATYLFGVENKSSKEVEYKLPIMMPKEKTNFRPQEGVKPEELVLGGDDDSDVWIEKKFKPSMNIIGFAYQVPARFGEATLTFTIPEAMSELQFMVPDDLLVLKSAQMERADNQGFAGKIFDGLRAVDLKKGSIIQLQVSGVEEGRGRYLVAGIIFISILFGLGMFLTYKTNPRFTGDNEEDLII